MPNKVKYEGLTGHITFDRGRRNEFKLDIMQLKETGLIKVGMSQGMWRSHQQISDFTYSHITRIKCSHIETKMHHNPFKACSYYNYHVITCIVYVLCVLSQRGLRHSPSLNIPVNCLMCRLKLQIKTASTLIEMIQIKA